MIEQKYSAKQKSINNVAILLTTQMLIPIILIVMIIAVHVIVTTTTKIIRDTRIITTRMFLLRIRIVINSPEKASALHAGAFELEQ